MLAVLALGFLLGMRHATDSDHVVAVTAIVSRTRTRRAALWIGMLWGLGHGTTVLGVGSAIVLFGWIIPPRLGLSMEMGVAVMLIVLGAINLTGTLRQIERTAHGHPNDEPTPELTSSRSWVGAARPIVIGVVHGLAGSAAIALLVLASIRSAPLALAYLAVFGIGTVAGMMLITSAMALPLSALNRRIRGSERRLPRIAGVLSLAFGLFLAYQIGVTEGLLTDHPHWSPY
ncbi:MAG TPA: sulfite exporter TauE/SafE family protein [Polyangiaceae bacterium]|nr:sulfite exporter TauE/SafE family protein [Polyangiaceae bacterium]